MLAIALDLILAFVLVEAVALTLLFRRKGRGIPPGQILGTLAAGFFLMLAARLAMADVGDGPLAACLLAALVAHLTDLASRWRGG